MARRKTPVTPTRPQGEPVRVEVEGGTYSMGILTSSQLLAIAWIAQASLMGKPVRILDSRSLPLYQWNVPNGQ